MKLLLTAGCLLLATTVHADSTKRMLDKFPYSIRSECRVLTNTDAEALACCRRSEAKAEQRELVQSQIRLNNARAGWFERHKNNLNYRGFPMGDNK